MHLAGRSTGYNSPSLVGSNLMTGESWLVGGKMGVGGYLKLGCHVLCLSGWFVWLVCELIEFIEEIMPCSCKDMF